MRKQRKSIWNRGHIFETIQLSNCRLRSNRTRQIIPPQQKLLSLFMWPMNPKKFRTRARFSKLKRSREKNVSARNPRFKLRNPNLKLRSHSKQTLSNVILNMRKSKKINQWQKKDSQQMRTTSLFTSKTASTKPQQCQRIKSGVVGRESKMTSTLSWLSSGSWTSVCGSRTVMP